MNEQMSVSGATAPAGTEPWVQPTHCLRRAAEFTGEPGCIAAARELAVRFLQQLGAEWLAPLDDRTRDDVLLVVSELVTNAERHSHGPYVIELEGTAGYTTVTVYDSSATLPRHFPPDPSRLGGHGMEIVRAVSDVVTAEIIPVGKRVSARFDLPHGG
ncbi:ATP-binding protein [Streptomyces montanisoli]|uniref:ATP-binding protein n=1 Tax=Streptomyces montanisoli TaxID=2798581 RepID=A0A940M8M1_9ACTN|nr:ATP-binding protein [Streptomyces montanisoli]MBP0456388.1 ATP-binding protein [Streptomyces montanisoli]